MPEKPMGILRALRTQTGAEVEPRLGRPRPATQADPSVVMQMTGVVPESLLGIADRRSVFTGFPNTIHYVYETGYGFMHERARRPVRRNAEKAEDAGQRMQQLLADDAIESGSRHPAEEVLARLLQDGPGQATAVLMKLADGPTEENLIDVLRLVGRAPAHLVPEKLLALVVGGLDHNLVTVRDSAVRALELLGTPVALAALKTHADREAEPWLAEYARTVVAHRAP